MSSPDAMTRASSERIAAGVDYACAVLEQADGIVLMTSRQPRIRYSEQVGPHLRHIVEHFGEFLAGLQDGSIDYDRRGRERALEREPLLMRSRLVALSGALRATAGTGWPSTIQVVADGGLDGAERFSCTSSPLRELLFLASHATHHFALLKLLLVAGGIKLSDDFGKAPATIRFERDGAASRAA